MVERHLTRVHAGGARHATLTGCGPGRRLVALVGFVGLVACNRGGHVAEATMGPSAEATAAPRSLLSAPPDASAPAMGDAASGAPALSASASAAPSPSASASASTPPPLPVIEVRASALYKKFSVSDAGEITMERDFGTEPLEVGHGKVPPERLSALHKLLREVSFCALAPSTRESSPGYITIEARFPDVTCSVELPDKRWDTNPKAKRVIEAVRALESEGCPKGCKP